MDNLQLLIDLHRNLSKYRNFPLKFTPKKTPIGRVPGVKMRLYLFASRVHGRSGGKWQEPIGIGLMTH